MIRIPIITALTLLLTGAAPADPADPAAPRSVRFSGEPARELYQAMEAARGSSRVADGVRRTRGRSLACFHAEAAPGGTDRWTCAAFFDPRDGRMRPDTRLVYPDPKVGVTVGNWSVAPLYFLP